MKHRFVRRCIATVCSVAIALSPLSVHAAQNSPSVQAHSVLASWRSLPFDRMNTEQQNIVRAELRSYGLSDADILHLIEVERQSLTQNAHGVTFFRRPRVGEQKKRTLYISTSTLLTAGSSALEAILAANGVPLGVAAYLFPVLMGVIGDNTSVKGVYITVTYVYGETNDGVPGWNVGPVTWRLKR